MARLGGDEFTLLLEKLDPVTQATGVAQRLNEELAQTFSLSGYEVITTVSIGMATSSICDRQPGDLLRDAGIALYRAKARYVVFDQVMYEDIITAV